MVKGVKMLNIERIQAAQGDCIWIEYGKNLDSLHRILIDGATIGIFSRLKIHIESLPAACTVEFANKHYIKSCEKNIISKKYLYI